MDMEYWPTLLAPACNEPEILQGTVNSFALVQSLIRLRARSFLHGKGNALGSSPLGRHALLIYQMGPQFVGSNFSSAQGTLAGATQ
jgi:hypothetical protein